MTPTAITTQAGARAHGRALLTLALPLIGSNLAQNAIQFVDVVMLGWYDVSALAAVSIATPYWFLLFLLGAGFAWAVTPLVAEAAEAGDMQTVRRVTRMGIWLSTAAGLLFLPAFWWSGAVLRALGQEPEIAELAQSYLRITGFGLIAALVAITFRSFLSALEITRVILWVSIVSALINAGLNWVLIFGNLGAPELGIRGAAFASLTLQVGSLLGLGGYAMFRCREYDLFRRLWRMDGEIAKRVIRLGLPMGLTTVAEASLFSVSAIMMGWLGEVWLAAHGIALQLASLTFMIHLGFSQAATVRAGRAYGRGDPAALRMGALVALGYSGIVAAITVAVFLLIPETLTSGFVDPSDPLAADILKAGVVLLAVAALFQIVDAAQVMVLGFLRGIQDTGVPLLIATLSYYVIGLPAGYVLGFVAGYGGPGVWMGMMAGLGVAAVLLSMRFWRRMLRLSESAGRSARP